LIFVANPENVIGKFAVDIVQFEKYYIFGELTLINKKMKKSIITGVFCTALILIACGPSKEEQAAREKYVADSVAQAIAQQQADARRIADSLANQTALRQQVIDLKAQLEAAIAKLNDTEQFKLLRTQDEKQQQIEDQTRIVETLKQQIADIEKQIN
jgi:hydroxylamine reductase (hybrid-cluster protein)